MWADLQETFYLCLGPLIVGLILPLFISAGIILAILMAISWLWRPLEQVMVIRRGSDADE